MIPIYDRNFGCVTISPIVNTIKPTINIHGELDKLSINIPNVPHAIPPIIVGNAGSFCTILDTNNCKQMITPALITVTCSVSNFQFGSFTNNPRNELTALFTGAIKVFMCNF